jgi:hypothetical protein
MSDVPHLMAEDALKIKRTAHSAMLWNAQAHIAVSASALISLVEQAHRANLGLATTRELREELDARGPDSPDDYRTFVPEEHAPNG